VPSTIVEVKGVGKLEQKVTKDTMPDAIKELYTTLAGENPGKDGRDVVLTHLVKFVARNTKTILMNAKNASAFLPAVEASTYKFVWDPRSVDLTEEAVTNCVDLMKTLDLFVGIHARNAVFQAYLIADSNQPILIWMAIQQLLRDELLVNKIYRLLGLLDIELRAVFVKKGDLSDFLFSYVYSYCSFLISKVKTEWKSIVLLNGGEVNPTILNLQQRSSMMTREIVPSANSKTTRERLMEILSAQAFRLSHTPSVTLQGGKPFPLGVVGFYNKDEEQVPDVLEYLFANINQLFEFEGRPATRADYKAVGDKVEAYKKMSEILDDWYSSFYSSVRLLPFVGSYLHDVATSLYANGVCGEAIDYFQMSPAIKTAIQEARASMSSGDVMRYPAGKDTLLEKFEAFLTAVGNDQSVKDVMHPHISSPALRGLLYFGLMPIMENIVTDRDHTPVIQVKRIACFVLKSDGSPEPNPRWWHLSPRDVARQGEEVPTSRVRLINVLKRAPPPPAPAGGGSAPA